MAKISRIHHTWINSIIEGGASLKMPKEGAHLIKMSNNHDIAHDGARRLYYPSLAWPHGTITRCDHQ